MARGGASAGLGVITALAFAYDVPFDHGHLLAQQVAMVVFGAVMSLVMLRGRRLNESSIQLYRVLAVAVASLPVTTTLGWGLGVHMYQVLLLETLVVTYITVVAAITLDRRLLLAALPLVGGLIVAYVEPSVAIPAAGVVGQIGCLVVVLVVWTVVPPRSALPGRQSTAVIDGASPPPARGGGPPVDG